MSISDLRREIEEIDRAIVQLLSKRLALARELSRLKDRNGRPVYDRLREEYVRKLWIELSRLHNVPSDLTERLAEISLEMSKLVQCSERARRWRDTISVGVIPGNGLEVTFIEYFNVVGIRFSLIQGSDAEAAKHDLLMIFADDSLVSERSMRKVVMYARDNGVVLDFTLDKRRSYEMLNQACSERPLNYISAYTLFGVVKSPVGKMVLLVPGACCTRDALSLTTKFLTDLGMDVRILKSIDELHRITSVVQALHHVYMLSLGRALKILSAMYGINYRDYMTYSLELTERAMLRVREHLKYVAKVQLYNSYAESARRVALEVLQDVVQCLNRARAETEILKCLSDDHLGA